MTPKSKKAGKKTYKVSFEIRGSRIDKDTDLGERSLQDFIELHFSHREDCDVRRVEVMEVKE